MYHGPDYVVLKVTGLAHHPPPMMSQGVKDCHHVGCALQSLPLVAGHPGDIALNVGGKGAEDDRALSPGALHQDELAPALVSDVLSVCSAQLLAGLGMFLISMVLIVEGAESFWISAGSLYCEAGIGSHKPTISSFTIYFNGARVLKHFLKVFSWQFSG